MSHQATWTEAKADPAAQALLVTYVLGYDDLGADDSATFRIGADVQSIAIGRAEAGRGARRASASEIVVADKRVSNRHVVISRQPPDRYGPVDLIRDPGSKNGTFVNGKPLEGTQRLVDGDLIEVGRSLFCYRLVPERLAHDLGDLERGPPRRLGPTSTRCPQLALLASDLLRIARSTEPVLILGETGVGKEVIARAVHAWSERPGPFCAIDCGAVPESLFEATFFGHRRGAFTGAAEPRIGEVARAHRGTLFLDEVANMPLSCQGKLLRVIEEEQVTPLGGGDPQPVDVRWIAATNNALVDEPTTFRADLLHRLAGYVARVPALRKRREDLGALTAHLLREAGLSTASIASAAGRALFSGSFPGNVRQLRRTLRAAALLAGDRPIDERHLAALEPAAARRSDEPASDAPVAAWATAPAAPTISEPPRRRRRPDEVDPAAIDAALTASSGNVVRAAKILQTHPKQLYRWIERLGLSLGAYRK